ASLFFSAVCRKASAHNQTPLFTRRWRVLWAFFSLSMAVGGIRGRSLSLLPVAYHFRDWLVTSNCALTLCISACSFRLAESISMPFCCCATVVLFELEDSAAYNLTVDLDVHAVGAYPERTRA